MKIKLLFLLSLLASTLQAQLPYGNWNGLIEAGPMKLHLVFHFDKDAAGNNVCTMDSPDQSAKGIPAALTYFSEDSLCVEIAQAAIRYSGKVEETQILGTFSQMGRSFPLNLQKGEIVRHRPQHPVPPYPYTTENVVFENTAADVKLAGTLTYPVGYKKGQVVPVVLMVTGSGPENRDSEIFDHKFFAVIADYLAKQGIASLRYDDRGVGASTGNQVISTQEVAEDAACGIKFLRQQKDFSKVGIIGHSEGASVAFILGARQQVDFVVSMAGIGVKGSEVLYAQAKKIVELSGQTFPMDKEKYLETVRQQQNPWLTAFLDYNPVPDIQKTKCPVLALNGDKDVQVLSQQNLTAIQQSLPEHPQSKTKCFPGLNHLFQHCTTGLPTEYAGIDETISPEVLENIATWIRGLQK